MWWCESSGVLNKYAPKYFALPSSVHVKAKPRVGYDKHFNNTNEQTALVDEKHNKSNNKKDKLAVRRKKLMHALTDMNGDIQDLDIQTNTDKEILEHLHSQEHHGIISAIKDTFLGIEQTVRLVFNVLYQIVQNDRPALDIRWFDKCEATNSLGDLARKFKHDDRRAAFGVWFPQVFTSLCKIESFRVLPLTTQFDCAAHCVLKDSGFREMVIADPTFAEYLYADDVFQCTPLMGPAVAAFEFYMKLDIPRSKVKEFISQILSEQYN